MRLRAGPGPLGSRFRPCLLTHATLRSRRTTTPHADAVEAAVAAELVGDKLAALGWRPAQLEPAFGSPPHAPPSGSTPALYVAARSASSRYSALRSASSSSTASRSAGPRFTALPPAGGRRLLVPLQCAADTPPPRDDTPTEPPLLSGWLKLWAEAKRMGGTLAILFVALCIGTMASKEDPVKIFTYLVTVCEKTEKIHKLLTHVLPIVTAIVKSFW